jgi:hypothetical protein
MDGSGEQAPCWHRAKELRVNGENIAWRGDGNGRNLVFLVKFFFPDFGHDAKAQ